ncbi:DUF968 domain-containing protein [Pantoea stewartii]|uniref:DUF968 domain-containing protein n=1 Tax=Pantoea stewartii TaxID=66269 RepID=UPI00138FF22A|nr:DUF968 domain-containing protein [Pantoea stewartii]
MKALLTPEIAPRLGVVLFRPGPDVMALFRQGRVLIEAAPDSFYSLPSGLIPDGPASMGEMADAKPVLKLSADPDSPESFMLLPKKRRWVCKPYTDWVKGQPCEGCRRPGDDPHHITGYGMGGMATKAHDLFVIPLCRECHDKLHANTAAFEEEKGTQLELLFRFLDRALGIGVIVKA